MIIKIIKIITKVSIFSFISLLFNIIMLCKFLSLWMFPQEGDIELIINLIVLLIFEFFMIHSRLFINIIVGRSWVWLKGVLFFGSFVGVYYSVVSDNFILIIYCSMVLNRTLSGILNREKTNIEKEFDIANIYTGMYIVLLVGVAVVCSSVIPTFGLTIDFLNAENHILRKADYGPFYMPHVAMCFGFLYYLILAFIEMSSIMCSVKAFSDRDRNAERTTGGLAQRR